MSEDAHNSNNDPDIDPTVCCIFGCNEPSTVMLDDHWYCDPHGKEYLSSREPNIYRTCQEPRCLNEGRIRQQSTGKYFCTDHAWSADRTPEEGLAHPKTESAPIKKSLEDVGTRWRHIADFQDYLADGLQAVTTTLQRYDNSIDAERKKTLEGALKLIEAYQMQMAGYESKKWDLNNILDKCVPSRETIAEIREIKEHEAERAKLEKKRKTE
jgi:hypothetical protein